MSRHCGVALLVSSLLAMAAASPARGGEDTPANFNAGWDDPNWILETEAARGGPPEAPASDPAGGAPDDPAIQLGGGDLRFKAIEGTPGASFTPGGGPVSLGMGLTPRSPHEPNPAAGFGAMPPEESGVPEFGNGFLGAFSLSETTGSVTQSMSITAPFSGDETSGPGDRAPDEGVKTMFGLGYTF